MDAREAIVEARNHVENFPLSEGDALRVTRLADALEAVVKYANQCGIMRVEPSTAGLRRALGEAH